MSISNRIAVFYNVENLFDTKKDPGTTDGDFTPEGIKEWTDKRYKSKLHKISEVLCSISEKAPALIGLCEVENREVIQDLLKSTPIGSKANYEIVHEHSSDIRGIDVSLLYDTTVFKYLGHNSIPIHFDYNPQIKTRDLLIVEGMVMEEKMYVVVCHWPSSWQGDGKSIKKRKTVAKALRHEIDTLFALDPQANILVMGDFNTEPDSDAMQLILRSNNNKDMANDALYNMSAKRAENGYGSNTHDGNWMMVDQFLCSKSLLEAGNLELYPNADVYSPKWLLYKDDDGYEAPFQTYSYDVYHGGYSDHLPVYITFK